MAAVLEAVRTPEPLQASISTTLSGHFLGLRYARLPEDSRKAVKRLLLDYLGVAIGGSASESGAIARELVKHDGGTPEATVIGDSVRLPAGAAAFANAIASHSLELDDIDVLANFHFSPPVFSTALAAAEVAGANGKQLLAALAAGCEMMERVSRAANPSLRERNYHTTPTCGVFGATVAAAKLLGLPAKKLVSAIGLAGAQASGVLEFQGPSMQKRFGPGPAARGAITAVRMAALGYTGQAYIFEGRRGFLKAYTDAADMSELTADLDRPYRLDIEFKPYACARPIHNAIDCALDLRSKHAPDLARVERIEVARHPFWVSKHGEKAPKNFHAAQLSLPYSVAVALKEGRALLAQYTDRHLRDATIQRLMSRTFITVDETLPRGVSCRMTMKLDDDRRLVSQVDYPKGSIQVPMSDAELEEKFMTLAEPVVGPSNAERIVDLVARIHACEDAGELMRLTRKAGNRKGARRR
ncbi:MAG TPA: MmgE/PrpD family protein [Burkholderiales bacterium]|nr:MmgE/PrpD family protein [Burkholderiales bacterium]